MKGKVLFIIFAFLFFPIMVKAHDGNCFYKSTESGQQLIFDIDSYYKNASLRNQNKLTFGGFFEGVSYSFFENGCSSTIYFNICTMNSTIYYSITLNDMTNDTSDPYQMSCKSEKYVYEKGNVPGSGDNPGSGSTTPGGNDSGQPVVVNCSYLFGDPDNSNNIAYWLQWSMNLIKYIGIIALFLLSTVDFVKALIANDQDAIKKAGTTAMKRFIYCVLLFFLPIIVDYAMTLLGAYGTCNIG